MIASAVDLFKRTLIILQDDGIRMEFKYNCEGNSTCQPMYLGYVRASSSAKERNHYVSLFPASTTENAEQYECTNNNTNAQLTQLDLLSESNCVVKVCDVRKSTMLELDVGKYLGDAKSSLSSHDRYRLLTEHYNPQSDPKFLWPFTERTSKGKVEKRFLRPQHLDKFPYLIYSPFAKGCFCLPCVLFGPCSNTAGAGGQPLRTLVTEPLQNYSHLTGPDGYLAKHENCLYHQYAVARPHAFTATTLKDETIVKQLDTSVKAAAQVNRKRLVPIVKTVLFCARSNIPLRGHRDDGLLTTSTVHTNDGIFRNLLRFRMDAGDEALSKHLDNAPKNARPTYTSKVVQNELIAIGGNIIRDTILSRIKNRPFPVYTIMVDETTDVSTIEQMSIVFRYVDYETNNPSVPIIREDFVDFIPVYDLSGRALANKLTHYVSNALGQGPCMVGQAYDGAAAMGGRLNGVQALVRQCMPMAVYVHCVSHCLNLVLSTSCSVPAIRNALSTVSELAAFVHRSAGQTID